MSVLCSVIMLAPAPSFAVGRDLPAFADGPDPATHPWLKEQLLKQRVKCPAGNSQVVGPADALVTITEFMDYLCPYCQEEEATIKKVLQTYPHDVKLVIKHHPLDTHQGALSRAKVAQAMAAEGKFWQAHEKLLKGAKSDDVMKDADQSQLKAYWSGGGDGQVKADIELANRLGLAMTPSFVIDGIRIQGAVGYAQFKTLIDYELARKHARQGNAQGNPGKDNNAESQQDSETKN